MATSLIRKFKRTFSILISLFILGFFTQILHAQTITNARYNTPSQDIITVTLSAPVTISTAAGWSANVGGVLHNYNANPAILPNISYLSGSGTNVIQFRLLFVFPKASIIPADVAIGVTIAYDGTGNTGPGMPATGSVAAINDVIIDCSMLTSVQSIGVDASSGACQPVTVDMKFIWNWSMQARNSIHFNPNGVRVGIFWGNTPQTSEYEFMNENPALSGTFEYITNPFSYAIENKCAFTINAYPEFHALVGDPVQTNIGCFGSTTLQTYYDPCVVLRMRKNLKLDCVFAFRYEISAGYSFLYVTEKCLTE